MPIPNMQNIDINQLLLSQTQDFYDTQESRNCTYSRDSCIWKFFLALLDFSRGESNSPGFYKFCEQQFMILLLFLPYSSSFSFSLYLVAHRYRRQDEMTRKRQRKKIRDNEIKKEKNCMNYLPYTEIVNSGATGLTSAVSPEVQFYTTNAEKEHFCQQK